MKNNIDVFKHILFRIAGDNFGHLQANERFYKPLHTNSVALASSIKQKEKVKAEICDILFILINVVENPKDRNLLINFKRDFYNGRNISEAKVSAVLPIFTAELSFKYDLYRKIEKDISFALDAISKDYPIAYDADLEIISTLCSKDYFKNGLLLSSEVLFKFSKLYANDKTSIDENTILGLWKYVTRTITKSTPFSTLTQLNIGTISNNLNWPVKTKKNAHGVRSYIRYNNYILELFILLIKNHPLFFKYLNIKANPTVKETGDALVFFTNNNNNESVQTIKSNGIIKFILNTLGSEKEMRTVDLINELLPNLDAKYTNADAEKYIFELIQTGIIYIDVSISGLDSDWGKSLMSFIDKYIGQEQTGKELIRILELLEQNRSDYGTKNCDEREKILSDSNKLFNELFQILRSGYDNDADNFISALNDYKYNFIKTGDNSQNLFLHKLPGKENAIDFKNIIYEDSSKNIEIKINWDKLKGLMHTIGELTTVFSCIPYTNPEKIFNYHFYLNSFEDHKEVNLLAFYENLYLAKSQNPDAQNQLYSQIMPDASHIFSTINQIIAEESAAGNIQFLNYECSVPASFLNRVKNEFSGIIKTPEISYSSFIQFFSNGSDGEISGIINGGIMPGKGRMISRFLYLFDDQVTEDLKTWNKETQLDSEMYVENSDASFFNANLHPCLMPYEINMPGGNNRDNNNLVNIADLKVRPNHDTKELELFHKNGKRVLMFDLGFQNQLHRSSMYRLLCNFGDNMGYPVYNVITMFTNAFSRIADTEDPDIKITISPRITIDKTLVLQRKQWSIPLQLFSFIKKNNATDAVQLYNSIQTWRLDLSIPNEVFIRLYHAGNLGGGQSINKDDYKPQYINFLSPMSVKLFIKTVSKARQGNLTIEEMLPTPDQLFETNHHKYANESLVQWQ